MKRAAMLYCANIDAPRYKVLKQRGQLPFAVSDDSASEGGDGKWADFTLDDAFRLRLMLDLIGGEAKDETQLNGLAPGYAQSIVGNAMTIFTQHPLNQVAPVDQWVGVIVQEFTSAEDENNRFSDWYVGELEKLPAWVAEKTNRTSAEPGEVGAGYKVVRLFLVNVTRVADDVRKRAEDLGLPEAVDFSVVRL